MTRVSSNSFAKLPGFLPKTKMPISAPRRADHQSLTHYANNTVEWCLTGTLERRGHDKIGATAYARLDET
jgi:hypothetical protein